MANITLNNWSAINLDDFSSLADGSAFDQFDAELDALDNQTVYIYDGNSISFYGYWGFWNISGTGTGLTSNNPIVTSISLSDGINSLKYAGSISLISGGTITSMSAKYDSLSAAFFGSFKLNTNLDIVGGTIKSASVSDDGNKVSFKGSVTVNALGDIVAGNISSFTFEDTGGHKISVSGISMSSLTFDGLSDPLTHTGLTDLYSAIIAGNDNVSGGIQDDILLGGAGNDNLKGDLGIDTQDGGEGSDRYLISSAAEHTQAEFNDTGLVGLDEVRFAATNISGGDTLTLFPGDTGIERVVIGTGTAAAAITTGTAALNIDASLAPNALVIIGNSGANTLTGTGFNDSINGGAGNDIIIGSAGNDTLNGGLGNDTLKGGADDDYYIINAAGDVIDEEGNTDIGDTIQAGFNIDLTLPQYADIENILLTGSAALKGTGNGDNNNITGNAGANILDGGAGSDAMDGGKGNDTYFVDNGGDTVTESFAGAVGGTDLVKSSVDFTLDTNVERLTLTGIDNIDGTGNTLNNIITGNIGANSLNGGLGKDTMIGGDGNDIYVVDSKLDVTTETNVDQLTGGIDTVQSSVSRVLGLNLENLTLTGPDNINGTGNKLANIITGNDANNILIGGAGSDTLTGGIGTDTFDFNAITESLVATHDVITDFNSLELDRIDLSTIDASTKSTGNQAFTFIGVDTAFSNEAGQLSFDSVSQMLSGDVNGDGISDFGIVLTGVSSMTGTDFIL